MLKHKLNRFASLSVPILLLSLGCSVEHSTTQVAHSITDKINQDTSNEQRPIVYQVFTRLFGNQNTTNEPWGTKEENGVGKFSDFTPKALAEIKALGVSHIWYTGVPHHALVADYTEYGISLDDPDVIKGRAGSPYAVKDYYNVNPDLADDPSRRLAEFEALIKRTHAQGMKVIIDIVPNHVARGYQSLTKPRGIEDFGASDDRTMAYARNNNFYYVPGKPFEVPTFSVDTLPLGGEEHPLADNKFDEDPAKWTGNGAREAKPDVNDWYETVKVNYGVRPNGSYDFPRLPEGYEAAPLNVHFEFWQDKTLPDSWYKFENIAHYWLDKGVDGFRFDMAEMVPVEFWSFLNSSIKHKKPDAFLLAEVYQPNKYRDYLHAGKMDYLYDKVGFYDALKTVMQGTGEVSAVIDAHEKVSDIRNHMLHFLENHDEQRIASPEFAGKAEIGKPALVVSALISSSPFMIYFGQEVGEDGSENAGFGKPSRTSIFDYVGVPAHQRWMNGGKFDGGQLTDREKSLREYYKKVLNIAAFHPSMEGDLIHLHDISLTSESDYSEQHFAFARESKTSKLIVVSQFTDKVNSNVQVVLPEVLVKRWGLDESDHLKDLLSGETNTVTINDGQAIITTPLHSWESKVYVVE
ncbi:alpha-amylase family protein [Alteromonas sp. ASW11-130]|uniref:alpha-amylase family protein n=1 Tax=Alteromonas sp. ASW11-130 TaxID=3015775 RepID=UPI0022428463|nr:alpha-amylase family protein [Alteromonas sp. ASW11-130]MCW8092190.1 alpha-amylase family protein [Alteromonas sp. ASW11-130]